MKKIYCFVGAPGTRTVVTGGNMIYKIKKNEDGSFTVTLDVLGKIIPGKTITVFAKDVYLATGQCVLTPSEVEGYTRVTISFHPTKNTTGTHKQQAMIGLTLKDGTQIGLLVVENAESNAIGVWVKEMNWSLNTLRKDFQQNSKKAHHKLVDEICETAFGTGDTEIKESSTTKKTNEPELVG